MMKRLTNSQINHLKDLAQKTDPSAHVGKAGVSEAFLKGLDEVLSAQELVKVRFSDFKDQRKTLAILMAEKTGSDLISVVGHTAVLYRENTDPAKRKIAFPAPRPVSRKSPFQGPSTS
ncbi:MAG: YhbY family RNA-binding protein [Pedosphaera sp.]|nr:YhbY family RNA-binding protein [Pedosphaera sp.]MST00582.1 YhbY family RNA-binding protein [Pedosphaera sp.]